MAARNKTSRRWWGSKVEEKKPTRTRRWEAALNSQFFTRLISSAFSLFDDEIEQDVETLRTRSREAAQNDCYATRYFDVITEKVIGPQGIGLRMGVRDQVGKPDTFANPIIQRSWGKYAKNVTVDGLNLKQTLDLILSSTARDGELFAVIRRGRDFGPYQIQLQLLEAEYLDVHLNATYNKNRVAAGIEYDTFGRRLAYHFYDSHPSAIGGSKKTTRVEAGDVIHAFDRTRVQQGRGVPWLAPVLETLNQIKEYKKTELFASRVASAKMGFYTTSLRNDEDLGDVDDPEDDNARIMEARPGAFDVLPPGMDIKTFDPQHPHGNFEAFLKAQLRGVAAALGLSYNTIASDAESTSYSSLRQHSNDERATYRELQQFLIDTVLTRLFAEWLTQCLKTKPDEMAQLQFGFDKYNAPQWRCQTWPFLDQAKETAAIAMQLQHKVRSKTDVARSLGAEYTDVLDEIAAENAYAASIGVQIDESDAGAARFAQDIVAKAIADREAA